MLTKATVPTPVAPTSGALSPLGIGEVSLTSGFWADRQALNSAAIIPHAAGWIERLGWTANFSDARSGERFDHRGREFADSEIYKLIEAMSWDFARLGPSDLDRILERFLELVGAAQDPDGYLHTLFGRPWQRPRYSDFQWGHELYCFGHLLQAGVAHFRSTTSRTLLDIAVRVGDHVCTMFGPDGLDRVCGHAEIELGLVELYRVTRDERYLAQAQLFVDRRGRGTLPAFEFGPAFSQDDVPVRVADVLRGHAVRALYLAAGAVDVAVETHDTELLDALKLQWSNTVAKRTYITGGMGSHHMDEAFGEDFVLPADRSYCETCAGVASIMFSWRLLLATGDVKYANLIERTLFNVIATSPSADGRAFFYANTLHQRTEHQLPALNAEGVVIRGGASGRQPWFEVSCCPPNIARMLASLSSYVATATASAVQVHQYASGTIKAEVDAGPVTLRVDTEYPLGATVRFRVVDAPSGGVTVSVRIPDWAHTGLIDRDGALRLELAGYADVVHLRSGDQFTLTLDMSPRVTVPDYRIDALRGTAAVERGPEVWAFESPDLPEGWAIEDLVWDPSSATFDGRSVVVDAARRADASASARAWPYDEVATRSEPALEHGQISLVRYHSWGERGPSTMRVWAPTRQFSEAADPPRHEDDVP